MKLLLQPTASLPARHSMIASEQININHRRVWLFYNEIGAVAQCPYNWGVGSAFHPMKIHISNYDDNQKFRGPPELRAPTSSLRPFGPALGPSGLLDNVLHALRVLRPCDPRNSAMMGQCILGLLFFEIFSYFFLLFSGVIIKKSSSLSSALIKRNQND